MTLSMEKSSPEGNMVVDCPDYECEMIFDTKSVKNGLPPEKVEKPSMTRLQPCTEMSYDDCEQEHEEIDEFTDENVLKGKGHEEGCHNLPSEDEAEENTFYRYPCTLWCGDLAHWMDELFLFNALSEVGEVMNTKIIRNRTTSLHEGYGFVEFKTHKAADSILNSLNGKQIPGTTQCWRLNWATFGIRDKRSIVAAAVDFLDSDNVENSPPQFIVTPAEEFSVFVGDLSNEVTDMVLLQTFKPSYPSARSAKVVLDSVSGFSKGYGFVRFGSEEERDRALEEMNGMPCEGRTMRISSATTKKHSNGSSSIPNRTLTTKASNANAKSPKHHRRSHHSKFDDQVFRHSKKSLFKAYSPKATKQNVKREWTDQNGQVLTATDMNSGSFQNTTLFVGGLDDSILESRFQETFSKYGELVYAKIAFGRGCGFVRYVRRSSAEKALNSLNGKTLGASSIRISWGKGSTSQGTGVIDFENANQFSQYSASSASSVPIITSFSPVASNAYYVYSPSVMSYPPYDISTMYMHQNAAYVNQYQYPAYATYSNNYINQTIIGPSMATNTIQYNTGHF